MPFARNSEIFDSLTSRSLSLWPSRPCRGFPSAAPLWTFARNDSHLRVEILVVVFALRRELNVLVSDLRVLEDFAFVIADHDLFIVVIKNVAGINRHFAAAAGSVDYELRHGVASSVTSQALDDVDAFGNRRPQV